MKYLGKIALCLLITIVVSSYSNNFSVYIDKIQENGFEISSQVKPIILYVLVNIISIIVFDIVVFLFTFIGDIFNFINKLHEGNKVCWEEKYNEVNEKYENLRMRLKEIINHFITLLQNHKVSISNKDLMPYIRSISNHIDKAEFNILKERCTQISKELVKDKDIPIVERTNDNFIKRETK